MYTLISNSQHNLGPIMSVKLPAKYLLNLAWWFICCTHYWYYYDTIVWRFHYSRLYDAVINGNFQFKPNYLSGNFGCISRLLRREKLVLSPHRAPCLSCLVHGEVTDALGVRRSGRILFSSFVDNIFSGQRILFILKKLR